MSIKAWADSGLAVRDSLLYTRLAEAGHRVTFVTYGGADDRDYLPRDSRINVCFKPKGMTNSAYGRDVWQIHKDSLRGVAVIKSHQVDGARYAAYAAWKLGKPYLARCGYLPSYFAAQAGNRRQWLISWCEELLAFHRADLVCVPSRAEIDYVRQQHRVKRHKLRAAPNWIDTKQFAPDTDVFKEPRRICFIGRFHAQKDPLLVLEAIRELPGVELLMIGGGELWRQIEEKISTYHIQATLLDRQPNERLPQLLNSCCLYVLPTHHEGGSPKSLLEAMACGLPVVSTNAFGVNEAFEHDLHGWKCSPGDVRAFRDGIGELLNDPARCAQLGKQARAHVVANYSVEAAVQRETAFLAELVKRAAP